MKMSNYENCLGARAIAEGYGLMNENNKPYLALVRALFKIEDVPHIVNKRHHKVYNPEHYTESMDSFIASKIPNHPYSIIIDNRIYRFTIVKH